MNILLVTADSLRCDRTSLFNHRRDTTPFLSELANRGFEFRLAYANGRNTAASFPSIHTSTHESHYDGIGIPDSGPPTMAELLSKNGYQTHGIHTNELISRDYNYDRGFDRYHDSRTADDSKGGWRTMAQNLIGDGALFNLAKGIHLLSTEYLGVKLFDTADSVSGFREQMVEWTTESREDWFVWAHYMNPHHPYEPPPSCQRAIGLEPVSKRTATSLSRKMRLHPENVTETERQTLRELYDASVLSWDRELASTFQSLKEAGELEDTLVIVTADHGELLGEDDIYGHPPVLNQSLLRVPLVFAGDPVDGGETDVQVGLVDLLPTVARLIGAEIPDECRGRSLYDPNQGFGNPSSTPQFCGTGDRESPLTAGIDGNTKAVHDQSTDEWEGYVLSETALTQEPAEIVTDGLKTAIRKQEARSDTSQQDGATVDQEQLREDLQALGYLE